MNHAPGRQWRLAATDPAQAFVFAALQFTRQPFALRSQLADIPAVARLAATDPAWRSLLTPRIP